MLTLIGPILRWAAALFCGGAAFYLLLGSFSAGGSLGIVAQVLFGFAFLITGAVLLSTQIAEWLSSPFVGLVNSVYLGTEYADKPPFTMDLGLHYEKFRQPELAQEHYERMIHFYPGKIEPYAGLIRVLRDQLDLEEEAEEVRQKAALRFPPLEVESLTHVTANELIEANRTILIR